MKICFEGGKIMLGDVVQVVCEANQSLVDVSLVVRVINNIVYVEVGDAQFELCRVERALGGELVVRKTDTEHSIVVRDVKSFLPILKEVVFSFLFDQQTVSAKRFEENKLYLTTN